MKLHLLWHITSGHSQAGFVLYAYLKEIKNLDLRHIAIFIHLRTINTEEYSANLGNKFYKKRNKMGYSGKMPNAETLWF